MGWVRRGAVVGVLVCGAGCAPKPCPVAADLLPSEVVFRTATESFNQSWDVALREDRVCMRERGVADAPWVLLGDTGRPDGRGLEDGPVDRLVAISADGTHLQAVDAQGRMVRATDLRRASAPRSLRWTDRWGWPMGAGDGLTLPDADAARWVVSDSHPFDVAETTDVAGVSHPVGLGVGHVYRLSADGQRIHLNDWWLPEDWSRQVCLPGRGRVPLAGLSASASTLFVVDARGGLHTRLYDVDNGGENDLLTYAWDLEGPRGTTRALPAAPWVRQPDPPGRVTVRLSIHQDGRGDTARVLRVEGERDGEAGVFEKRIDAAVWHFRPLDAPLSGPLLDPAAPLPDAVARPTLHGRLSHDDVAGALELTLPEHDAVCSPTAVGLAMDGEPLTIGGVPLELELHLVPGFGTTTRPADWRARGLRGPVRGALLGVEQLAQIDDPAARRLARSLLGDGAPIAFVGRAGTDGLDLEQIPRSHRFGVEWGDKVRDGHQVRLRAAVGR